MEGLSKIITLEEAKEADYNLSPSRFVIVIEEEKYKDIREIKIELKGMEKEEKKIKQKIMKILKRI
ncbi:hypothetical protein JGI25_00168 [Candidatus Kryptobacter tengchongensis]|uniref:Uncharacterized protein n=1 Tax=Kryptobacter tengchongensis TaxID=1643429 RepID=A0A916LI04_KRYT1|nr:hypothetical protein JGI25_00168 [Candidatus Kryptobacter tengchongensis]